MAHFELKTYVNGRETSKRVVVARQKRVRFSARATRLDRDNPDESVVPKLSVETEGRSTTRSQQADREAFDVLAPRVVPIRVDIRLSELRDTDVSEVESATYLIVPHWSPWVARPFSALAFISLLYLGWLLTNVGFASFDWASQSTIVWGVGTLGPAAVIAAVGSRIKSMNFTSDWRWGMLVAAVCLIAIAVLTSQVTWLRNGTASTLKLTFGATDPTEVVLEPGDSTLVLRVDDVYKRLDDANHEHYCIEPEDPERPCQAATRSAEQTWEKIFLNGVPLRTVSCRTDQLGLSTSSKIEVEQFDDQCRPQDGEVSLEADLVQAVFGKTGVPARYQLAAGEGKNLIKHVRIRFASMVSTTAGLAAELRGAGAVRRVSLALDNVQGAIVSTAVGTDAQVRISIERRGQSTLEQPRVGYVDCRVQPNMALHSVSTRGLAGLALISKDEVLSQWHATELGRNLPAFYCKSTKPGIDEMEMEIDLGENWLPDARWQIELPALPQAIEFYRGPRTLEGRLSCGNFNGPGVVRAVKTSQAVGGVELDWQGRLSSWAAGGDASPWVFACEPKATGAEPKVSTDLDPAYTARWNDGQIVLRRKAGKTCRVNRFRTDELAAPNASCAKDDIWLKDYEPEWRAKGCEVILTCPPTPAQQRALSAGSP